MLSILDENKYLDHVTMKILNRDNSSQPSLGIIISAPLTGVVPPFTVYLSHSFMS